METRILSGTDLTVSRVCFGTMTFGGQTDKTAAGRMLDLAFDQGVNFVDTANVYNAGESERLLGELIGERRQRIVLASKVGMKTGDEQPGLSRPAILAGVDNTLRRLRTDYLDIYYLHAPDWGVPIEESLEALTTLVKQGKVRHAASSNYASWQVCQMWAMADKNGTTFPRITQPMYNVLARRIEDEYLPMCKAFGVSTVVYNPLAGGLLTNKHHSSQPLPGTRFDGNKMYRDRYWKDENFEAVARVAAAASTVGRSIVSIALNWLLHHSPADCLIIGASKIAHLEDNLRACLDGPLPAEAVSACDGVWRMVGGIAPKYNR